MTSTQYPDLEEQIREKPTDMLECRDLRHAWASSKGFFQVEHEGGARGVIYAEREVTCTRCGTLRQELFAIHKRSMEKLRIRYVYPAEYRLHGRLRDQGVSGLVQFELYERATRHLRLVKVKG